MSSQSTVAVTSRSFSRHPVLRKKLSERYPNVRFNDEGVSLKGDDLVKFLSGSNKAITALEKLDHSILSQLPDLKIVSKYGVGLDMIDLDAMKKLGIKLGWTSGVNRRSVSELTLSAMISLLHKVPFANQEVRDGKWYQVCGRQLTNKVVGIVGCGNIGKDLAMLLQPFNCSILAYDLLSFPEFYKQYNIEPVSLDQLLKNSDVVTLHLPLNDSTNNLISREKLELMKEKAVLINYARGGIMDDLAAKELLSSGYLGGAAFDVFAVEPPSDPEIGFLDNVLVTPHIGGSTEEAILAMGMSAIDGLDQAEER